MKPSEINYLACPVCGEELLCIGESIKSGVTFKCPKNHSFDVAKERYIHLLPSNMKNSRLPGDNKEMVKSRRLFHSGDYYASLKNRVCEVVREHVPVNGLVVDSGSGEGYYTSEIKKSLSDKSVRVLGLDISKEAVKLASKSERDVFFIVAGSFHMPIKDSVADVVTNIFAPLADKEIHRILCSASWF